MQLDTHPALFNPPAVLDGWCSAIMSYLAISQQDRQEMFPSDV